MEIHKFHGTATLYSIPKKFVQWQQKVPFCRFFVDVFWTTKRTIQKSFVDEQCSTNHSLNQLPPQQSTSHGRWGSRTSATWSILTAGRAAGLWLYELYLYLTLHSLEATAFTNSIRKFGGWASTSELELFNYSNSCSNYSQQNRSKHVNSQIYSKKKVQGLLMVRFGGGKVIFREWSNDLNEFDMLVIHKASNRKNHCPKNRTYRLKNVALGANYEPRTT